MALKDYLYLILLVIKLKIEIIMTMIKLTQPLYIKIKKEEQT
jgi:hypothetical protein